MMALHEGMTYERDPEKRATYVQRSLDFIDRITDTLSKKMVPFGKLGAQVITVTFAPRATHSRQCSKVRLAGAFTSGGKLSDKKRICKSTPIQSNLSFTFLQVHRNGLGRQDFPKFGCKISILKPARAIGNLYQDQLAISQLEVK